MKKRNLLVGGVIGLVLFLLVAIGGLGIWGWGRFTDQAMEALNSNPVILSHVGKIDQLDLDFMATGNEEGENVFVFRVGGSSGTGVVVAEFVTVDADAEEIHSGTLRLPSGETYDLMVRDQRSQDAQAE
jgi:hypothetical protein